MTNKQTFLHHLHQARVEYIRWVGMVKLLSAGLLETNKQDLELNMSEIDFGKWLYNEALLLRDTASVDTLNDIESLWKSVHTNFMQIYELCVLKNKSGIFGRKKPLSEGAIRISAVHYQEIVVLTDTIKQKLTLLEKQLKAQGEEVFESYGNYLTAEEENKIIAEVEKAKKKTESISVGGARGAYLS